MLSFHLENIKLRNPEFILAGQGTVFLDSNNLFIVSDCFTRGAFSDVSYSVPEAVFSFVNTDWHPSIIAIIILLNPAINELVLQNVLPNDPIVSEFIEFLVDLGQLSHLSAI